VVDIWTSIQGGVTGIVGCFTSFTTAVIDNPLLLSMFVLGFSSGIVGLLARLAHAFKH
jgi:hypothetical protein